MHRPIIAALAGLMLLASLASAPALADNSQQSKMTSCNADATSKGLSGDDRKAFMKTCLSASSTPAPSGNSQTQKMKTCNATATSKGMSGDDRKAFMKTCLSSGG